MERTTPKAEKIQQCACRWARFPLQEGRKVAGGGTPSHPPLPDPYPLPLDTPEPKPPEAVKGK